jgi:CrcB protein
MSTSAPPADRVPWDAVAVVAAGGVLGAEARYGIGEALPHTTTEFPWATVLINASGCLAIGVLLVVLLERTTPHRLWRPFLAVGVLGGYTTFSSFSVDVLELLHHHCWFRAAAYLVATLVSCPLAVALGAGLGRTTRGRRT